MDLVFYDLVYIGITEILDKCNKEIKLHVSFVNRDEYNFQKSLWTTSFNKQFFTTNIYMYHISLHEQSHH